MDEVRFHDLLGRYHDGEATPEETVELESLLRADPECRRLFVERNLMEVQLAKSFASSMAGRPAAGRRSPRRRKPGTRDAGWTVAAAAAVALFAALVIFASVAPTPPSRRADTARTAPEPARAEQAPEAPRPMPVEPPQRLPEPKPAPVEPLRSQPVPRPALPREEARPAQPTSPASPKSPEPPPAETRAAVAVVVDVEGSAVLMDGARTASLVEGAPILAGQGLRTSGEKAVLRAKLADGTLLVLEGSTEVSSVLAKRILVERGTLRSQIAKQPQDQPLVFATPHGEAKVLGTSLKLIVEGAATRLEVEEGRVRLKRLLDGRTVDVVAGHFAVAAAGAEVVSRPLPITDIQLLAAQGQIAGDEWRAVKDDRAAGGLLLEAAATANFAVMTLPIDSAKINAWFAKGRSRSWVTFTFTADADTDYWVWVRGRCVAAPGQVRLRADDVVLEVADATYVRRPADWKTISDYVCAFNGYGAKQGFWWSGGSHDPGNTETPIALRFKKSGRQVLRMHAMETPIQVDAIWLSTTKTTRPGAEEMPGKR